MGLRANNDVTISPQGYQITDQPDNTNPFWGEDDRPAGDYVKTLEMTTTTRTDGATIYTIEATNGNSVKNTVGAIVVPPAGGAASGTVTGVALSQSENTYTITYTDDTGEHTAGTFTIPEATEPPVALASLTLTNENGVYTLAGTDTTGKAVPIGTIEVPSVEVGNLLAEVNDSIVENNATDGFGYDFHTITETENNGTRNNVGQFYLAQRQILRPIKWVDFTSGKAVVKGINFDYVDQNGKAATVGIDLTDLDIPGGAGGTTPKISATATVDDTTGTPSVSVTKSGTDTSPSFAFAFSGIKGETGATGPQGETGPQGVDGTTPTISATATVDDTTGTPSVSVTKSGTAAAPSFDFAFSGLKGADGAGSGGGSAAPVILGAYTYALDDSIKGITYLEFNMSYSYNNGANNARLYHNYLGAIFPWTSPNYSAWTQRQGSSPVIYDTNTETTFVLGISAQTNSTSSPYTVIVYIFLLAASNGASVTAFEITGGFLKSPFS